MSKKSSNVSGGQDRILGNKSASFGRILINNLKVVIVNVILIN